MDKVFELIDILCRWWSPCRRLLFIDPQTLFHGVALIPDKDIVCG
jgi:hypothetical protein